MYTVVLIVKAEGYESYPAIRKFIVSALSGEPSFSCYEQVKVVDNGSSCIVSFESDKVPTNLMMDCKGYHPNLRFELNWATAAVSIGRITSSGEECRIDSFEKATLACKLMCDFEKKNDSSKSTKSN